MKGRLHFYPSAVVRALHGDGEDAGLLLFDPLVINGVEDLDDIALAFDGVGQENMRAFEVVELLYQERLAVSGLSIKQQRIGGTDGRTDLRKQPFRDHHFAERLTQRFFSEPAFTRPLLVNHLSILRQRDWRGTRVLVGFQMLAGAASAGFRERQYRRDAAHAQRTLDLNMMLQDQGFQHILDHAEFQPERLTQVLAVKFPAEIENLEEQVL
jgi:hypothetical protein